MNPEIISLIKSKSAELFNKVKEYRRHIHQYPELSFQEHETMTFVSEKLKQIGIEHKSGIGGTGIVALIRNSNHTSDMKCIALRADLDALPIKEETDLAFKSKHEGVMHACGHDVHTSILLGAAEILVELKEYLPQPVKLIFQPGEEKNPGGATLMIKDGVLSDPEVSEMYALHVFPELEAGKAGFKEGIYMASSDEIYITIHGKGGHGALPQNCIDPIMIGANLLVQLQQIVSRKCDPKIPSVLSFGHFEAIGATNVIPSECYLKGTFRTMNEEWRTDAHKLIEQQTRDIVKAHGGEVDFEISKGYPFLSNDISCTTKMRLKAFNILGETNVVELPIRMTAEDFAFYSQKVPVCFFRLGTGHNDGRTNYGVHHPKFDIDERALLTGVELLTAAAF